ncbi:50S ribosomal protein L25 [Candidatus Blochmannia ocreatus (nom. nud.)]|uniref:50S ribosomal protein L25 n=1 Tax=Candidatus Blochmannia ocreatus (nom. nud.) TaxID=251538 RepID=A0ABY4SSL0_9ENTR|nr:50S ribosomal protein L25 [Candidatus Blochmannia ocreatus]URJ24965.1 50S ribosomal protein L25 [Candidatus Blochmannia ocreatus]
MLTINAISRIDIKKSATRKLRTQHKCPGVIYSKKNKENSSCISLNQNDLLRPDIANILRKNNILQLSINNKASITVRIQDIQYHPFKLKIIHIDFTII